MKTQQPDKATVARLKLKTFWKPSTNTPRLKIAAECWSKVSNGYARHWRTGRRMTTRESTTVSTATLIIATKPSPTSNKSATPQSKEGNDMSDAQIVFRWTLCQEKAEQIGMTVSQNAESFSAQGIFGKGNFHGFYSCDSINELLGFLNGVIESNRVRQSAQERGAK